MEASASASSSTVRNMIGLPYPEWMGSIVLVLFYIVKPVYNFARVHETLRNTPAMVLGIADRVWMIGNLLDAALAVVLPLPTPTAPDRRRQFRVIQGGKD